MDFIGGEPNYKNLIALGQCAEGKMIMKKLFTVFSLLLLTLSSSAFAQTPNVDSMGKEQSYEIIQPSELDKRNITVKGENAVMEREILEMFRAKSVIFPDYYEKLLQSSQQAFTFTPYEIMELYFCVVTDEERIRELDMDENSEITVEYKQGGIITMDIEPVFTRSRLF